MIFVLINLRLYITICRFLGSAVKQFKSLMQLGSYRTTLAAARLTSEFTTSRIGKTMSRGMKSSPTGKSLNSPFNVRIFITFRVTVVFFKLAIHQTLGVQEKIVIRQLLLACKCVGILDDLTVISTYILLQFDKTYKFDLLLIQSS